MKSIIQFTSTITLLLVLTAGSASSQTLINKTACDMYMSVHWATSGCTSAGNFATLVPAYSTVPYPLPRNAYPIAAKGEYTTGQCGFKVGIPCTGLSDYQYVYCLYACGTYQAKLSGNDVAAYR